MMAKLSREHAERHAKELSRCLKMRETLSVAIGSGGRQTRKLPHDADVKGMRLSLTVFKLSGLQPE